MGYMIPFTQFEYVQYTNRTISAENLNRYTISGSKPIQPIQFLRKNESMSMLEIESKEEYSRLAAKGSKAQISAEAVERTMIDITGIGKFINYSV